VAVRNDVLLASEVIFAVSAQRALLHIRSFPQCRIHFEICPYYGDSASGSDGSCGSQSDRIPVRLFWHHCLTLSLVTGLKLKDRLRQGLCGQVAEAKDQSIASENQRLIGIYSIHVFRTHKSTARHKEQSCVWAREFVILRGDCKQHPRGYAALRGSQHSCSPAIQSVSPIGG
jgi:hypothetical protein